VAVHRLGASAVARTHLTDARGTLDRCERESQRYAQALDDDGFRELFLVTGLVGLCCRQLATEGASLAWS
jgi:hypothetical protein